ncbi:DUF3073 domain-containing protein [Streptosporangium sp. KLBMP 9127]
MGRGRAKAKQTKVARELKYSSHSVDFDRLYSEIGVNEETERDEESERPGDGSAKVT